MGKMGNDGSIDEEHLQVGSKVEVFCEEDGFQNSWFSAVILRPPYKSTSHKKRKRSSDSKFLVQYENFLTDGGNKPLTEFVDVSFIRPLPPPQAPEQLIEINDVVDALHRDVWWTGVVTNVVGDKYYVKFKFPPDILELDRSQIRLHWDWVKGIWSRPGKQETTESSLFSPGEAVEVNLDNELPCIVWSPASFLGEVGPNYFLVQSKNFETEDECLHKISVQLHQIRPHPPRAEVKFDIFEKVDAFDGIRWWVGVITKVLIGSRYTVTTMHAKKAKEYDESELRPHLEWVGGKWETKSMNVKYSPVCKPLYPYACNSTKNSKVATRNESRDARMEKTEEETSCSTNKEDPQMEQKIKQQEVGRLGKVKTVSSKESGRLLMRKSEFIGTWTGTFKRRVILPKSHSKNMECLLTGSDSEVLTVSHAEKSSVLPNKNNAGVSNEIRREEDKLSITNGQAAAVGKQHNGTGVSAVDCAADKVELPITARVEVSGDQLNGAAVVEDCRPDKSKLTAGVPGSEDVLRDGTALVFTTDCLTEDVMVAVDGIPSNCVPPVQLNGAAGDQLNGTAGVEDCRTNISELTVRVPGSEDVLRDGTALFSTTDCLREEVPVAVDGISSSNVSDKQLNGAAGVEDCRTNESELDVRVPDCLTEVMVAVDGISSNDVLDNQPLSVHINEIHCIENTDDSGFPGDNEQNISLSLPFVKKFPIWQQIESMEVFRKLPQNPHFQPLVKSKEVYREGFAIGNMLAFVSFVEMIAKLEIDSPGEFFNGAMETLVEMEKMGFNVEALQGRLNELQLLQVKLRQLQDDSIGIKTKIIESSYEKIKTNQEVGELLKEMKKLEEKKARLITKTVSISTDLDVLQSEDSVITQDILRMKQTFLLLRQF